MRWLDYRAYVLVEPDTDGFGSKLAADLSRYDYKLQVDVEPDTAGFRQKLAADLAGQAPVEVPVQADVAGFEAKLEAALAGSRALAHGGIEVPVRFDEVGQALADISHELMTQTDLLDTIAISNGVIQRDVADTSADLMMANVQLRAMSALLARNVMLAGALGGALAGDAGAAGGGGGGGFGARLGFGFLRFGGALGTTAIHGIISSLIEFTAVAIPAAVAAGAWAADWAQGAQNVYQHMQAVYTATEATANIFHTTAGQAIGLSNALQVAQNKANPQVYEALGSGILALKQHFAGLAQTGLQVGSVFDRFSAKLVYDLGAGGAGAEIHALLSRMVTDLTQLGQIAGNVGHALLNLAADMPGLANVLLDMVDGVSTLVRWFSELPKPVILTIFALHEFNTWGSVLIALMGRMGLATATVEGSFLGFGRAIGILRNLLGVVPLLITRFGDAVATVGARLPIFSAEVTATGEAMAGFGVDSGLAVAGMSGGWVLAIAGAAIGLGILIDKLVTARSATQAWVDSLQAAVDKASNTQVLGVLAQNIGALAQHAHAASSSMANLRSEMTNSSMVAIGQWAQAADKVDTLNTGLQHQAYEFQIVLAHAQTLADLYGTSLTGALSLANLAGIKLSQTLTARQWAIAQIQVQSLVAGFKAMGQGTGAVGSDMQALAIQAGLAGTKVSQLNQAWDEFMQNLTAGTGGLAAFNNSLTNLGTVAATTGINNLGRLSDAVTLKIKNFQDALTSFSGKGATAWQNFDQVVGSTAPQLIDWLRIAGAEGAISGHQFSNAILSMIQPLAPLAAKSQAAKAELVGLAQQAGLGIKSFPQLQKALSGTGVSSKDLAKAVSSATTAMSNMGQVGANLGQVVAGIMNKAFAEAAVSSFGLTQKIEALDTAIRTYGADSPQAAAAALVVRNAEAAAVKTGSEAAKVYGQTLPSAMQASIEKAQALKTWLDELHSKKITITVDVAQVGGVNLPGGGGRSVTMPAGGYVVPGYAPGKDTEPALLSKGEAVMVPEWVRAVGADNVMAMNRYFSGGRETTRAFYAGGGINMGAAESFNLPRDTVNININANFAQPDKSVAATGVVLTKAQQQLMQTVARNMQQYANQQASNLLSSFTSLSAIASSAPTDKAGNPVPPTGRFIANQLHSKLTELHRFFDILGQLKRKGVARALIEQVYAMGPDQGIQYARAILSGGNALISRLNREEANILGMEKKIGQREAEIRYGTPISQGFAMALKSAEVEKALKRFGRSVALEIAHELGVPLRDVPGLQRHPGHHDKHGAAPHVEQHFHGSSLPNSEQKAILRRELSYALAGR